MTCQIVHWRRGRSLYRRKASTPSGKKGKETRERKKDLTFGAAAVSNSGKCTQTLLRTDFSAFLPLPVLLRRAGAFCCQLTALLHVSLPYHLHIDRKESKNDLPRLVAIQIAFAQLSVEGRHGTDRGLSEGRWVEGCWHPDIGANVWVVGRVVEEVEVEAEVPERAVQSTLLSGGGCR
jgi:hypothetical protein